MSRRVQTQRQRDITRRWDAMRARAALLHRLTPSVGEEYLSGLDVVLATYDARWTDRLAGQTEIGSRSE
jgi:hypothetical protein